MNNEPIAWLLFSDGDENYPQYTKSYKQMREWETYLGDNQRIEPHYTHPVKEQLTDEVRDALMDALAGWKYIRHSHGDLYGVGWDRVEEKLEAILRKAQEK